MRLSLARRTVFALLVMAAFAMSGPAALALSEQDRDAARQTVTTLGADLAALSGRVDGMSGQEAVSAAGEVVRKSFNLERIAAATVGTSVFQKWTADQQRDYVDAFIRYTLASQTGMLTRYKQDRLTIQGVETAPDDLTMVRTKYAGEDGTTSRVDFLLAKDEADTFRIVDLVIDGSISQLTLRRAEFKSVLKSKGYDGLLAILRKKADQLIAKRG
jgi:phospholipid transport system substrate-binding protein